MALEGLEGTTIFSEGSGGICGIFEWLQNLEQKNRGSCEVCDFFFMDFWWIFVVFGVART
jgi:hypothetical protein